ncbi:MAG: carboxypeptidase-like regulatory domain-containing protein [Chitinophagaceae bacterium]|nr:carboxypeptidase-like regulatory domain-containing protein [Chitinophagaceae bacterium]
MKKTLPIFFLLSLFCVFVLFACKKDDPAQPTNGKLIGSIQTWDDKTTAILDKVGITVSTDYPTVNSTTTDANGKFSFDNLDFDKYDLSFSKPGYGTYKIFSYAHNYNPSGPQTINTIPLINFAKKSTTTITNMVLLKTSFNGINGVSFQVTVSPNPTTLKRAYIRYFLSNSSALSSSNYLVYTPPIGTSSTVAIDGFSNDELTGFGFSKGQTIYIKAYGESVRGNDYDDPNLRKRIFPNLNSTTVPAISFVMQ